MHLFSSAQEFLHAKRPDAPGCLVLDVRLPGMSGLTFQQELAKAGIALPVIFITGHGDVPMTVRAMKAGAVEFLTKPFDDQELLDAIHAAIERDRAKRRDAAAVADLQARYRALTEREREIMALVVAGRVNKQIAGELGVSEVTVKVHRGQVMRKMRARSLAELVRMADRLGLPRFRRNCLYQGVSAAIPGCDGAAASARARLVLKSWRLMAGEAARRYRGRRHVDSRCDAAPARGGGFLDRYVCKTPKSFLASVNRATVACLVTDMRMPGMTGLEL